MFAPCGRLRQTTYFTHLETIGQSDPYQPPCPSEGGVWRGRLPRYFFDTCDGERQVRDEAGIDLASPQDIAREAAILLQGLGLAEMLKGRSRVFTVRVRREDGAIIYRGTAKLDIE